MSIRWMRSALLLSLMAGVGVAQEGEKPYSDHVIVRVNVENLETLDRLDRTGNLLSCRPMLGEQLIVLHKDALEAIKRDGIETVTIEPDAQAWIDRRAAARATLRAQRGIGFYEVYRRYDEISVYLDGIVDAHPAVAERISVGTSLGDQPLGLPGLEIFAIRITGPEFPGEPERPVVAINGCQHAREWISPMANTFVAEALITGYGVDPRITAILDEVEVHVIPVVNPNGYEYTFTNDRFWRKNRRSNDVGGVGVDPNRNWPVGWNNGQSTSTSGGSDLYVGPAPLSEPETNLVAQYLQALAGTAQCLDGCGSGCCDQGTSTSRLKGHIDVHSFSQVILGPWGFTSQQTPPKAQELTLVQEAMSEAMFEVDGAPYPAALGTTPLLPPAGGVMPDWTFGELGALSWTIEMRPSTGGLGGFELPEDQIDEASAELLAAVLELADHARKRLGLELATPVSPTVGEGEPIDVALRVTPFNGNAVVPGSVLVRSRTGDQGVFAVDETTLVDDVYRASIAGPACDQRLEYYFEAMTEDGVIVTLPENAPQTVFASTGVQLALSFEDGFESDLGWEVDPDQTDGAETGIWERADPIGTVAQPEDDFSVDGTLCFVTGNGVGGAGADDVDDGATTLVSPSFDLTGATSATLSYARWFDNGRGGTPNEDSFVIQISPDGGQSWVSLETVGPSGPGTSGGWIGVTFLVEGFIPLTDDVRVRFIASDFGGASLVEAAIDAFEIRASSSCTTEACSADFDGDGDVDLTDFGTFGAAFNSQQGDANYTMAADFDGDGDVDLTDFGSFGAQFNRTDCAS